jgi:quinol monooxygenase YgiN
MTSMNNAEDLFVVTAFWEARLGEEEVVAAILSRYAPQAREEPGVVNFVIHRSRSEPSQFFFYEVFKDEAAFAAHRADRAFRQAHRRRGLAQARQARARPVFHSPIVARRTVEPRPRGIGLPSAWPVTPRWLVQDLAHVRPSGRARDRNYAVVACIACKD